LAGDFKVEENYMADKKNKGKSKDLDLDVKKTGRASAKDQSGELADGDLNKVAGGLKPNHTVTCPDLCGSTGCGD
jgi:hypothetical protein